MFLGSQHRFLLHNEWISRKSLLLTFIQWDWEHFHPCLLMNLGVLISSADFLIVVFKVYLLCASHLETVKAINEWLICVAAVSGS